MLATIASILDIFQYASKDIISRASSSVVSVHFFHKSSCAMSNPLDALDKFYKNDFISLVFRLLHHFHRVFFLLLCGHFHGLCAFA